MIQELNSIADEVEGLLPRFQNGGGLVGQFLYSADATHFDQLLAEARHLIGTELGHPNNYSFSLTYTPVRQTSSPSYSSVQEAVKTLRRAARTLGRTPPANPQHQTVSRAYVDPKRISELESIENNELDFAKLIELCREINVAAANECHMSTAMLLRTILDHIPPVFNFTSFAEVANNYSGPQHRSFKTHVIRLQTSLRSIADMHLHSRIRALEDLPTFVQVDFSQDLDVLLGEIIRVAKRQEKPLA